MVDICDKDRKRANKVIKRWSSWVLKNADEKEKTLGRMEKYPHLVGFFEGNIKVLRTINDPIGAMDTLSKSKSKKKLCKVC